MNVGVENSTDKVAILNIGSEDRVDVLTIARGWKGDVKLMQLDMSKLRDLGWHPQWGSFDAVRLTAKSIVNDG